jgi:hypothetical protein
MSASTCIFNDHLEHTDVWKATGTTFNTYVDPIGGDLTGISCASSSVCLDVDITGYEATLTYSSSTQKFKWSSMTRIDPAGVTSISCANAFYCGAVDQNGDFVQWFNGKWSSPVKIDASPLVSISCASDGRCAAIDQNNAVVSTVVK